MESFRKKKRQIIFKKEVKTVMKVMNRKSFFIIFVLIFTLVFTGCNAETTTQPQDNSVEPNQNEASQELKGDHFELLQKATAEFLKGMY